MKKLLTLLHLLTLTGLPYFVNAQIPDTYFLAPHNSLVHSEAASILRNQMQKNTLKTSSAEVIISRFSNNGYNQNIYHDSVTYSYSGSRGISVTTDLGSYFDEYYPINSAFYLPWLHNIQLTMLYDTATYYSNATSWRKAIMKTRNYDIANNLIVLS